MPSLYKVAVYGTLRQGFCRHNALENSEFLGTHKIDGFKMIDLEAFPGILPEYGKSITAEVYEVDKQTVLELDKVEGYTGPNSFYQRQISELQDGTKVFIYVINDYFSNMKAAVVECGDWFEYLKRRIESGTYPFIGDNNLPKELNKLYYFTIFKDGFNYARNNPDVQFVDYENFESYLGN